MIYLFSCLLCLSFVYCVIYNMIVVFSCIVDTRKVKVQEEMLLINCYGVATKYNNVYRT